MARERILKAKFFRSETIAKLPYEGRLAFQCMWCHADRNGTMRYNSRLLKSDAFPFDDISNGEIEVLVGQMVDCGLLAPFEFDGVPYLRINGFSEHQKPHPKEPVSYPVLSKTLEILPLPGKEPAKPCKKTASPGKAVSNSALPSLSSLPSSSSLSSLPSLRNKTDNSSESSACPLLNLPLLSAAYPSMRQAILIASPRVVLPTVGSQGCYKDREALEHLVRLDGYTEREVRDTLRWVLKDEPEADFTWRQQFQSIKGLRKVSKGTTKFTKMHAAWQKATGQAGGTKKLTAKEQVEEALRTGNL